MCFIFFVPTIENGEEIAFKFKCFFLNFHFLYAKSGTTKNHRTGSSDICNFSHGLDDIKTFPKSTIVFYSILLFFVDFFFLSKLLSYLSILLSLSNMPTFLFFVQIFLSHHPEKTNLI